MPDYTTQALYCGAATITSLHKLLSLHKSMQVCMSSFSVLGHSLVIYRWHISINIMLFHSVSVMASTVCTVAQRVVKCAGMLFRVCVRVPSYETDTGIGSI